MGGRPVVNPVRIHLPPLASSGRGPAAIHATTTAAAAYSEPVATQPSPAAPAPVAAAPSDSAWSGAWRASAWAAFKEFAAQATGATVGLLVRGRLAAASPPVAVACGVGAALVMGWMVYRASRLAAAAAGDHGLHESTTRLATVALPTAAVVAATVISARVGALAETTALLTGKLTQRSVRYSLSTGLGHIGPRLEFAHRQGVAITARERVRLDWDRAMVLIIPTVAFCLVQEYWAPTPGADELDIRCAQLLPYVLAVGLVEAGRAFAGTLVQASEARAQGWTVQLMASCSLKRPDRHVTCATILRDAGDAAAMRQVIGVAADLVSALSGQPARPLSRVIVRALRSHIKALGEFRAPLVHSGRIALADRARPASAPVLDEPPAFMEPIPITALA